MENVNSIYREILGKLQKYCAYQERCHKEVEAKLRELKTDRDTADQVILDLLQGGFLNEERFARAFAGGKFRTKKWGRLKIERELKARDISEYCIRAGMQEINESDYMGSLEDLALKKDRTIRDTNQYVRRRKIADHLIRKGYEPELVWDHIRNTF